MRTFYLKTREGEIINKEECYCINDARIYFSMVKRLKIRDLLNIFVISE